MKLVNNVSWRSEVVDRPPVRLNYQNLLLPDNVELTFIGTTHDTNDENTPDYLDEVIGDADIFLPESPGWNNNDLTKLQRVANGDFKARQKALEQNEMHKRNTGTPGQNEWMSHVYKALYGSRVKVALVDFPARHPTNSIIRSIMRQGSLQLTEPIMQLFAKRDNHILEAMVNEIDRLKHDKRLVRKEVVKVLAIFGTAHYAVHDALAECAQESEGSTFSSTLLFEENAGFNPSARSGYLPMEQAGPRKDIIAYQNWLRTSLAD